MDFRPDDWKIGRISLRHVAHVTLMEDRWPEAGHLQMMWSMYEQSEKLL